MSKITISWMKTERSLWRSRVPIKIVTCSKTKKNFKEGANHKFPLNTDWMMKLSAFPGDIKGIKWRFRQNQVSTFRKIILIQSYSPSQSSHMLKWRCQAFSLLLFTVFRTAPWRGLSQFHPSGAGSQASRLTEHPPLKTQQTAEPRQWPEVYDLTHFFCTLSQSRNAWPSENSTRFEYGSFLMHSAKKCNKIWYHLPLPNITCLTWAQCMELFLHHNIQLWGLCIISFLRGTDCH